MDPIAFGAARDHADRARRGGRPHRRARARRGRLRDEAVLPARARRTRAHGASTRPCRRDALRAALLRRRRARRRHPRRPEGRRRGAPHGEGVRSALVPREPPAPRLRTRPADEPRLGIRGRARHGHGHGARPPPAGRRSRTIRPSRVISRRCGASATGSRPDARRDDRDRARRRRAHARAWGWARSCCFASSRACGCSSPASPRSPSASRSRRCCSPAGWRSTWATTSRSSPSRPGRRPSR